VNFVLDTNAVNETEKLRPNPGYVAWRDTQDQSHLFVTTITLAEVWQGFHHLEANHPDYHRIKAIAMGLPRTYRVLNFDLRAAAVWGELTTKANGLLPVRDSFIGAIARSRGYHVVTRDESPFQRMGCKVLNPWR
jgi:predicted nucleic acid-binding protein